MAAKEIKNFENKYIRLATIAGLVVVLDQVSKSIIVNRLSLYSSVPVIPGLFNLTYIQNPGGAFGFLAQQSSILRSIIFLTGSLLAIGLVFYLYKNTPKTAPLLATGISLILGGAVGNLIDRARFGKVVDFLDFYLDDLHWPAFNIADSAVSVGIVIFLFHILFKKMPK